VKSRKSFYRAFRKIAGQFTWKVDAYGAIRGKGEDQSEWSCPITALCYAVKGDFLSSYSYLRAGEDLNMPRDLIYDIVSGADGYRGYKYTMINKTLRKIISRA
jgi:hypothetical protein